MKWLNKLFCKHSFKHMRNIYGDEINLHFPIKRSIWKCEKCGRNKLENELQKEEMD